MEDHEEIQEIVEQRLLAAILKSETMNTRSKRLRLYIRPDSIVLFTKGRRFCLQFVYWSESPCTLRIYYYSREDSNTGELYDEYHIQEESLPATEEEVVEANILNLNRVPLSVCSDGDRIPILLEIEEKHARKHRVYATISEQSKLQGVEIIKQAVVFGDTRYFLQPIYQDHDAGLLCLICCANQADLVLAPCHHTCVCRVCMLNVMRTRKACPLCRQSISEFIQINVES